MDFYCTDPISGYHVNTYVCSHNSRQGFGIACHGVDWIYLHPDLAWHDMPHVFGTIEEARACIDKYVSSIRGNVMADQYDFGRCPETGVALTIYRSEKNNGWGIARRNLAADYSYITADHQWVAQHAIDFSSKEIAEERVKKYMEDVLRDAVIPGIIDTSNMRIAFKCPMCALCHKSEISADNWPGVKQIIRRKCPKTPKEQQVGFLIKLWLADAKHPSAPVASISKLPNYDCKECWGTGEYIGFRAAEPCSTCFPKKA